jgi:hypothetical protein
MRSNWLPSKRADILAMAKAWIEVFKEGNIWEDWGFTEEEIFELTRLHADARIAFDRNNGPGRGPATAAALKTTMDSLVAFMRDIRRRRIFVPPLSNADLARLGLRPHDTTPTPQPVPSSVPEIETITSVIRELRFRLRDFGSKHWGKPEHVHGFEFLWLIADARPAHVGHLSNIVTGTRNPVVLMFDEADRGKRVFFAARWVNNTLQPGPWSDIESAVIP